MALPPRPRKLRGAELAVAEAAAAAARRRAKRLRRVAAVVAVLLTVTALLDQASRAPVLTIPRLHRTAQCDPTAEDYERDMIWCKGAEAHNTVLFKEAHEKAKEGLMLNGDVERWKSGQFTAGSAMATSIVQYYTALAMRSNQLFLINKVVHDFLMHFFNTLACTQLVDISESIGVNDTFRAPPFLCTGAVFATPPMKELTKYDPTVLMLHVQRFALMFCLLGSDFHEGTITYVSLVPFETRKFDTHTRPTFGYDATKTYMSAEPKDTWFELMTTIWKTPLKVEPIMVVIVNRIICRLNEMAATVPNEKATWNETFLDSNRHYSRHGYYKATRLWYEQTWDWAKGKVRRVNGNTLTASIKHSLYLTSVLWLSVYTLEGYGPFVHRWYFAPLVFAACENIIYVGVIKWPGCPVFDIFPELRNHRQ